MATIADLPVDDAAVSDPAAEDTTSRPAVKRNFVADPNTHVLTTIYSFPTMEPLRFAYYPHKHLYLPLRKDLLHKAVIYEGDKTRQGTASTKWRDDVHGSHRKVHPQKGLGLARVGDKQSPIRRGGGVAFGPKPRDFSSGLNRKVYDLAWRTALSYRYRKGELILVDRMRNLDSSQEWYLRQLFKRNGWDSSMLIASGRDGRRNLFNAMEACGQLGNMYEARDVDVKNLLERKRVIIERPALDMILKAHSSDLGSKIGMVSSELPPVLDLATTQVVLEQ